LTSRLKIRDLELIVALHEEGTFTQAAKRVGVTEPALSKRLLLIERMVQARLFNRGHDGATITGAGRHFVEHIQESVYSFHRAIHEAREAKQGERHKLRIGASAYLPSEMIELVRSIELRLYRDLVIELATEYFAELMAKLQRHQIDLALVTSPPPSAAITTLLIATNPLMIGFREGQRRFLTTDSHQSASSPYILNVRGMAARPCRARGPSLSPASDAAATYGLAGRNSPFSRSPSSVPCAANCAGTCHRRSSSGDLTNSSPASNGLEADKEYRL